MAVGFYGDFIFFPVKMSGKPDIQEGPHQSQHTTFNENSNCGGLVMILPH